MGAAPGCWGGGGRLPGVQRGGTQVHSASPPSCRTHPHAHVPVTWRMGLAQVSQRGRCGEGGRRGAGGGQAPQGAHLARLQLGVPCAESRTPSSHTPPPLGALRDGATSRAEQERSRKSSGLKSAAPPPAFGAPPWVGAITFHDPTVQLSRWLPARGEQDEGLPCTPVLAGSLPPPPQDTASSLRQLLGRGLPARTHLLLRQRKASSRRLEPSTKPPTSSSTSSVGSGDRGWHQHRATSHAHGAPKGARSPRRAARTGR